MSGFLILGTAGVYLYLLFAVAFYIDSRSKRYGSEEAIAPWVYSLSIAVYCTSWTFYGSVGRSAATGLGFLPVYIGPILVFLFCQPLLNKLLRICKTQHITTIADFISARYGRSQLLAGLVTIIAVVGIAPYISLQLKAVSASYDIVRSYSAGTAGGSGTAPFYADTAFYVAALMRLFVIAFGTRHVDATEQHRGIMTAVALESLVKLGAFIGVGVFITYGMFDGFGDLFAHAAANPATAKLLDFGTTLSQSSFWVLAFLSMLTIVCLPRQFQVTIVENDRPEHLRKAAWIFPLYLVAINLFVLPIALAGLRTFAPGQVAADTYVLTLPIAADSPAMALLAFIGGLSASTAMLIVETIALATMISNDLIMPLLIRWTVIQPDARSDISGLLKGIRRASIVGVLLLGYLYAHIVGDTQALVSIGLMSFVAAAQFAPPLVGALYWKGGTRIGALAGLAAGFLVWIYTSLLPSFATALPDLVSQGPFGIALLRPNALFGIGGFDTATHSLMWSLAANIGAFVLFSRFSRQTLDEASQALTFVDAQGDRMTTATRSWESELTVGDLLALVGRFVDRDRAQRAYDEYSTARNVSLDPNRKIDGDFVVFAERLLAGAIGSALARVIVASAIKEKQIGLDGVMVMLSDASQAIERNWAILHEAVENIEQGITVFDKDLRLTVWNRRFLELEEFPAAYGAVGTPFAAFIRMNAERGEYGPGDVEEQVGERVALALRFVPHRIERERPNGTILEIAGKPMPNGGFITTYSDVTELRRAERELRRSHEELERRVEERTRALRESEERFRDLATSASDWFWETDADMRFTYFSERFFELTGIPPAEIVGRHRWELATPSETERELEKWRHHFDDLDRHRPIRRFQYALQAKDGRTLHVSISGRPRFSDDGAFMGYRGTGTNVTELVLAQEELLRSERLAALGGLVAGVAHEINTPIGVSLTAASFLEERAASFAATYASGQVRRSEMEEFIRIAGDSSSSLVANLRRAADLVRSFKQVAVDQSSEQKRRFNLREYLEEILVSLHPKLKRTHHEVRIDCPDSLILDSHPGAYSQIVTNLVMNSLLHGFEGIDRGHIDIAARREGSTLCLEYRDDGKGMPPEIADRVFEPFFTTRRGTGGSGLGMHVVYNLVTQTLGGRIALTTTLGNGIKIVMQLPTGG